MTYYSDIFDKLHKEQESVHLSASLLAFLKNELTPYLVNRQILIENVLEIGCGTQSLFEVWPVSSKHMIKTAIDCSATAIKKAGAHLPYSEVSYKIADITDQSLLTMPSGLLSTLVPQDLVLDGHAIHFIKDKEHRKIAFKNIYHLLKRDGIFVAECTIRTNSFQSSDYFHLPYAHELEDELLRAGFDIKVFIVKPGLHLESYETGVVERFEVVTFIAHKK